MSNCRCKEWFQHAPCGMVSQKVILNEDGLPVDMLILAVNSEFEKMFGVKSENVTNSRLSKIFPVVFQSSFPWLEFLYRVAQGGRVESFEHYSVLLNRWFRFTFCPEKCLNITSMVVDITTEKIMASTRQLKEQFKITHLLALSTLQTFQDDCANAFRVALVLIGPDAEVITRPSNLVELRSHQDQQEYLTHLEIPGLWLKKIPLMVNDHCLGDLYVGQVRILPENLSPEMPADMISKKFVSLPTMSEHQFNQMVEFLAKLVNQTISRAFLVLQQAEFLEHQKKIEQELLAKNNLISSFLHAIPIPVFYQDLEGKYLGYNQAFSDEIGEQQIVKNTFSKKMVELCRFTKSNPLSCQDRQQHFELMIKNQHHQIRDVIFKRDTFLGANGQVAGVVGAFLDITERKNVEKLLKKNLMMQEMLRSISENFIHVPLEQIDDEINNSLEKIGNFVHSDRAYIFRYDFTTNTHSNTYEWCKEGISSEIDKLQNIPFDWVYPQLNKHMNGEYFTINDVELFGHDVSLVFAKLLADQGIKSLITSPIQSGSNLMGFVGFDAVVDARIFTIEQANLLSDYGRMIVNLLQRANTENSMKKIVLNAQQANKAKTEFISNISHEIRTPLNIIVGFHDLLKMTNLDINQTQYVDDASYAAKSMLEIVNDLLDLAKIEAGRFELQENWINLPDLIAATVKLFSPLATKKGLKLITSIFPSVPAFVMVDGNRLKQVVMNLLANAIKFTNQGEVEFKLLFQSLEVQDHLIDEGTQGAFTFVVRDTGVGMRPDQQSTIFQRFTQLENSGELRSKGSGLGLAISSSLVERMNGVLHVTSEVGRGSTFFFSLNRRYQRVMVPVGPSVEQKIVQLSSPKRPLLAEEMSILIAEDSEECTRLLVTIIQKILPHCHLYTAINGVFALDLFAKHRPHLMFLDVQMAELDGISCTQKIRAQEKLEKGDHLPVKIVAITGGVTEEERKQCLDAGMDAVLAKPISFQELDGLLKGFCHW